MLFGALFIVFCLGWSPFLLQLLRQFIKLALFHILCDVGVDIHSSVKVSVAKDLLDDLDIDAVLKQAGCESMPLWHNKDKSENPCVATGWRFVLILFPLKTALKRGLREGVKNQGCT